MSAACINSWVRCFRDYGNEWGAIWAIQDAKYVLEVGRPKMEIAG